MRYNSFFAGTEEIKDSTLERTASPASKAFNESRPRHLMSLALPVFFGYGTVKTVPLFCGYGTVNFLVSFMPTKDLASFSIHTPQNTLLNG